VRIRFRQLPDSFSSQVTRYAEVIPIIRTPPLLPSSQAALRPPGPIRTGREGFPSHSSSPPNASVEETRFRNGDADDEPSHGTREEVKRSSWHLKPTRCLEVEPLHC
jgi:hypothetical protein